MASASFIPEALGFPELQKTPAPALLGSTESHSALASKGSWESRNPVLWVAGNNLGSLSGYKSGPFTWPCRVAPGGLTLSAKTWLVLLNFSENMIRDMCAEKQEADIATPSQGDPAS